MIESRYTIEYVDPDSAEEPKTKKTLVLFAILSLAVFAILAYVFSFNQPNDFVRISQKTQIQKNENIIDTTEKTPASTAITKTEANNKPRSEKPIQIIQKQKDIDTLLLKEKQQASKQTKQLNINEALNQSINDLTKKLMEEREKNKILDKQLNSQKNVNNQLSNLLENALSKANTADKNYINALDTLEASDDSSSITVKVNNKEVEPDTQTTALNSKDTNNANNSFNTVSLSTYSQVDAIIAAMQGTAKSTPKVNVIKAHVDKTNEVQLASVSETTPAELLHIKLQQQIDQLLSTKNSTSSEINIAYKKALEKESNIHQNALRSITIQKGETLWSIAQRAYGNGALYKKIIEANPQTNLKKLFIGQVIRVPE